MFFSGIRGLWRKEDYIFIRAEYNNIKFHINEIESIRIADKDNLVCTAEDLPIRDARIEFLLKSGRRKKCHVHKLTKREYLYLAKLLKAEESE